MPHPEPTVEHGLAKEFLREQRSSRRWRNVRFFGYMFFLALYAILVFAPHGPGDESKPDKDYAALVRLNGIIMPNTNFSAEKVIPELTRAFKDKDAKGVVLVINSPGGSPVQSSIIHDKIMQLKKKYKKKVVVEGQDALASGAYMVASAADKIYVHGDTLTGSIGVILSSFGFTDAIAKIGVTRRVYTAGANKDRLDPFLPATPADVAKIDQVLAVAHKNFITDVVQGRGNRLRGNQQELFSGDFWAGSSAVKLGLADGVANLWEILDKEFKVEQYRDYTAKPSIFDMLFADIGAELKLKLQSSMPKLNAVISNKVTAQ